MDLTDSGFQDRSNKPGPSNMKSNTSENCNSDNIEGHVGVITELSNTSKSCVDLTELSSDSGDEDNSYYPIAAWEVSDVEVFSPPPLTTSSPMYNGEVPCIIPDNSIEILEENNNDPNNNLSFIEIPQESASSTNINDISKNLTDKMDCSRELMSPIPGCSKDMGIADNYKKTNSNHKMHKKAVLISMLLPNIEFGLIIQTLKKNEYAENYVELTLWDLLNKKRLIPQISKRRSVDDVCMIEKKKPVPMTLGNISNNMQTSITDLTESPCIISLKEKENSNKTESINSKILPSCEENTKQQSEEHKISTIKHEHLAKTPNLLSQNSTLDKCLVHIETHDRKDTVSMIQEKESVNNTESKTLSAHNQIIRPAKLIVPKSIPPLQSQCVASTSSTILAPPKLTYVSKYEVKVADNVKPSEKNLVPTQLTNKLNMYTEDDNTSKQVVNTTINYVSQLNIFSTKVKEQNCDNGKYLTFSANSNEVKLDTASNRVSSPSASHEPKIDASVDNQILLPSSDVSKESIEFVPSSNNDLNLPSTSKGITKSNDVVINLSSFQQESPLNISPTSGTKNSTLIAELTKTREEKFDLFSSKKKVLDTTSAKIKLSPKMMKVYYKLLSIFPYVNPDYIKSICATNDILEINLDISTQLHMLIEHLLIMGDMHPRITHIKSESTEVICDVNEQYENMLGIFPDADPTYLRDVVERIYDKPEELKAFVQSKLENHDYPTKEQYLAKRKITEQQKQYTIDFKINKFLEIFPNPFSYFEDPQRNCTFNSVAFEFLKYHYNKLRVSTILYWYGNHKHHLSLTARTLDKMLPDMKGKRITSYLPAEDIPLLQEIAFIQHRQQIEAYLMKLKNEETVEFQRLKETNSLLECQCCFDNECMPSKCSSCDSGHVFCNACIVKGTELKLAESETHIRCFVNCTNEFSLSLLQKVLSPTTFSILLKKRQEAEVMAAGLDGLVSCPFCHFASIPPPEDKVFKCYNPDCMKESCRLCKELNHIPLSCDEANSIKARHYIEEKMTQALIHTCYKCNRPFYKDEGCNRMVCVCGAEMCYICDKPVNGYKHFRGQGSTQTDLCPLWSDNHVINAKAVLQVAQDAEREVKQKNPNLKLVTEPILPKLPHKSKGPHEDIPNSDVIPERAYNVRFKQ